MTREQRQHAREQRALLALRRAAVRYSIVMELELGERAFERAFVFAELQGACDKYTEVIGLRARRKLVGAKLRQQLRSVPG